MRPEAEESVLSLSTVHHRSLIRVPKKPWVFTGSYNNDVNFRNG